MLLPTDLRPGERRPVVVCQHGAMGQPADTLKPGGAYPETVALIAPRPFMVECGYQDRVAALEWAAGEYSFVQRLYFQLGIPARTEMAFFDGPHMIHGERTFAFLHRHLQWPEPGK